MKCRKSAFHAQGLRIINSRLVVYVAAVKNIYVKLAAVEALKKMERQDET